MSINNNSKYSNFGYFSFIKSPLIEDGYYSQEKNYHHKVINHKVITDRRGIYTKPPKSGKGHDALFKSYDTTDAKIQKILEEGWEKDRLKLLEKINENKNKKREPVFKGPGVQHIKDIFAKQTFNRTLPLYKERQKSYKIINHKVIGEKKGIYTQPMKNGFNNTPGIYFSFIPLQENYEELKILKLPRMHIYNRPKSLIYFDKKHNKLLNNAIKRKNEKIEKNKNKNDKEKLAKNNKKDNIKTKNKTKSKNKVKSK